MKKLQYLLLCTLLLLMTACEKDTEPSNFAPGLSTGAVSEVYRMGATLSGSVRKSEGTVVKDFGILYSELQSMVEYTEVKATTADPVSFSVSVQGLEPGKDYYYCSYASSGYSIAKGEIKSFRTTDSNVPVFGELQVSNKDEKSFTVSTTIIDEGGSDLILRGFCWKLSGGGEPTVSDNVSNVSLEASAFTAKINDLTPGKEYLVCAYAINAKGVGYGKSLLVTTHTSTVPVVSSINPKDSTDVSITVEARILSRGEALLTEKGFCWSSESQTPTTANLKKVVEGDADTYNGVIDELKPATTYYIRAYAINEQGTGYGDVFVFTTPASVIPELAATTMTEIAATTAKAASSVITDNGNTVTERGFCLSKEKMQPDINSIKIKVDGTEESFAIVLTQLEPEATYYIRSYAVNAKGVGYGEANLFTTLKEVKLPTVTTSEVVNVSETAARFAGTIVSDGNSEISSKGFCWSSTNTTPTVNDTKHEVTASGTNFTYDVTNLAAGTKYYICAYAINVKGTSYGEVKSFATDVATTAPAVGVTTMSNITETTATASAEITSTGGLTISEKGFYYSSTNAVPTAVDAKAVSAVSGNMISSSLSGLSANTKYYIRAYAINSKGTALGAVEEFMTADDRTIPTVVTSDVTNIGETSARFSGNITSDGKSAVTSKGFYYGTSANPVNDGTKREVTADGTTFVYDVTNLAAGTKYYVCAYAANEKGVGYGIVQMFSTDPPEQVVVAPTVGKITISNIGEHAASALVVISSDGGAAVIEKGFCYSSVNKIPALSDNKITSSDEAMNVAADLIGLAAETRYYIRAYANNGIDIGYSPVEEFVTATEVKEPGIDDIESPDKK